MKRTLLPVVLVILTACSKTIDRPYTVSGTNAPASDGKSQSCDFGIKRFNLVKRQPIRESANRKPVKVPAGSANDAVILLDFNGQDVTSPSWNLGRSFTCAPANMTTDEITDILYRVCNDYSPFNVSVTTSDSLFNAAAKGRRMRVIVTETYEWYGMAGGIAQVGSLTWNDDTPCFVFSSLLNYEVKKVAEAISHEAGHTFGLYHQSSYDLNCLKLSDYNYGQGAGETGWAPIMGAGYYQNLSLWHNGSNSYGCTSRQDDIAIISSVKGMRADDHANTKAQATPLIDSLGGLLNSSTDIDFFYVDLNARKTVSVEPFSVGLNNDGADVDLMIKVYDTQGRLLLTADDPQRLQVSTTLDRGKYYIAVSAAANQFAGVYGMLGWYGIRLANSE